MPQGSSFGEECLLGRRRYEFTARTTRAGTVLYVIRADELSELLTAFPVSRVSTCLRACLLGSGSSLPAFLHSQQATHVCGGLQRNRRQNVRRELRQRCSEKLKELYRIAKQQSGGADGGSQSGADAGASIMDDAYGETERSGAAGEGAGEASNGEAIARLEKKASSFLHFRNPVQSPCSCPCSGADVPIAGGLTHGADGLHGPVVQCGGWLSQWLTTDGWRRVEMSLLYIPCKCIHFLTNRP